MKNFIKVVIVLVILTISCCTTIYAIPPSMDDCISTYGVFWYWVNEVFYSGGRIDSNTPANEILEGFIFNQYFEDGIFYHNMDIVGIHNDDYINDAVYNFTIDENGIEHELGYTKYYANTIDEILKSIFNVSNVEIIELHKNMEIHYYNNGEKKWYYNDEYYYVSQQGIDGRLVLDILDYKILNNYGDDVYKLELHCRERYGFEDEYIGLPFSMYCIMKITETDDFSVYAISINNDIEHQKEIKVVLGGNEISFDQPPINENGRVLLPIRKIAETLGADVEWNGATQTITAIKGDARVHLTINDKTAYKNGQAIMLDVPAKIINGRTLVPVRFLADCFDVGVDWVQKTQTVVLTTK